MSVCDSPQKYFAPELEKTLRGDFSKNKNKKIDRT